MILVFGPQSSGQYSIKLIGKRLCIFGIERFGAGSFHAGGTKLFHQVPSGQSPVNIRVVVQLSANADRSCLCVDDSGRQRNIAGDHNVAGLQALDNSIVRDIGAIWHHQDRKQIGLGNPHRRVGDEDDFELESFGILVDDFADGNRTGVSVDPNGERI